MTNEPVLLNIRKVSELTGFSVGTLYHWVSQRRIPVVRLSKRCIRFRRSDLELWLTEMAEAPVEAETKHKAPFHRGTENKGH